MSFLPRLFARDFQEDGGRTIFKVICCMNQYVLVLAFPHDQHFRVSYNAESMSFTIPYQQTAFYRHDYLSLFNFTFPIPQIFVTNGNLKKEKNSNFSLLACSCCPVQELFGLGSLSLESNITLTLYKICIPRHPLSHSCLTFAILGCSHRLQSRLTDYFYLFSFVYFVCFSSSLQF